MKKIVLVTLFGLFLTMSCQTQNAKSTFGSYYKIGEYNIFAPFAGQPHISPREDTPIYKSLSYSYTYLDPTEDINLTYGIDVLEFKVDTVFHNPNSKIDFVAGIYKLTFETFVGGKLVKEEKSSFRNNYCIKQKVKANIPNNRELYINSIYISNKGNIIRIYTFTSLDKDDNTRINDFFESIKFE